MRFPLVPILVMLIFNGLIDYCVYRIIRYTYKRLRIAKVYAICSGLLALMLVLAIAIPKRGGSEGELLWVMWSLYIYLTCYLPKYIFLIFNLLSKIPKIWRGKPSKVVSLTGAVLGVIVFCLMWWGALINRFNLQVRQVDVPIADLPESFADFRIAQISDLHVGTYGSDTTFISKLVDNVNAIKPDMIVFTGDMVNRQSDEFKPFISTLSRLQAPYGVYAIMGNHDYGDYKDWSSPSMKDDDVRSLKDMEHSAGLHMLNNEHVWIKAGNDSIALIGVENIGDPPFKSYGDLKAAYPDINDRYIKILLTHNPAHWESEIQDREANVALTLAGHTHAMQCELFGVSPAALRYDKWGGMYTDSKGQALYVNIGAGTVGMPFRIGANPEITLFTLTR